DFYCTSYTTSSTWIF
nr:immunoglobulin light chain junction region [Macaca mulatta]